MVEPNLDRDPYPWLIWYIWKARNGKLFRRIDCDPLELVHYAESECQAWFNANEMVPSNPQDHNIREPQVLSLGNICMIDGSWTSTYSTVQRVWMDLDGQLGEGSTYGDTELYSARVYLASRS